MLTSPALLVLVIAPWFGEGLSGASRPLALLVPWHFAFMVMLYGCGALICREVMVRFRLGVVGLCFLGAAYGVYEEALVDRYWFLPEFWETAEVGTYSVVWHTNVLLAVHLTAFHAAVSVCLSVMVVEWFVPRARNRPWVGRRGLTLAALALALTPLLYGEFSQRPPGWCWWPQPGWSRLLVAAAFFFGRRVSGAPRPDAVRGRPGIGWVAFATCVAHWIGPYAVSELGLPAPLGVLALVAALGLGVVAVLGLSRSSPYGPDGMRVGVGILSFFALSALFLTAFGSYDMVVVAVGAAITAIVLYRRQARIQPAVA